MSPAFGPVNRNERIDLMDALRGFALLGVIVANIWSFAGYGFIGQPAMKALPTYQADQVTKYFVSIFVETKFITIFSILFGAGFAIQQARAKQAGTSFKPYFFRRMLLMLLIGCIHAWGLWYGDITRYYAIAGLTLLLLAHISDKALLRLSIVMIVALTAIVFILKSALSFEYPYPPGPALLNMFTNGSYWEIVKANFALDAFPLRIYPQDTPLTIVATFGKIYLGYWIGRKAIFANPVAHKKLLNRWFVWGITAGLAASIVYCLLNADLISLDSPFLIWVPFVVAGGLVLHSLFYISAFIRLHQTGKSRWLVSLFRPVGRMSFSNYLFQTVISMFIFYGFLPGLKLFGKLGPFPLFFISIGIFIIQSFLSRWWLSKFNQGPVEWVWRKLAYTGSSSTSTEKIPAI